MSYAKINARSRLDWKGQIIAKVKEVLIDRRDKGISAATLRGDFLYPSITEYTRKSPKKIQESFQGSSYGKKMWSYSCGLDH